MSNVNVDLNDLIQAERVLKEALFSVQNTKRSIFQKYHFVGEGWNDKKYNELGDIVKECTKALNDICEALSKGDRFISSLVKHIEQYDNIRFHGAVSSGRVFGTSQIIQTDSNSIMESRENTILLKQCEKIYEALIGVECRPILPASSVRSEQQIISNISGGDMTEGSCSSLAFTYAGNRAGYVVHDFRDGQSREVFSLRSSVEQIASMEGVISVVICGTDDSSCAEQLLSSMEHGRQYYLATGAHAAIVRLNDEGVPQYLELQSGTQSENGWHALTRSALYSRFGCEDGQSNEYSNYLIDLDSLQSNTIFLDLLGYINTDESAQVRGAYGHVR